MPEFLFRNTARFLIYGLIDPRTQQIRYVGKSTRGMRRVREHYQARRIAKEHGRKANWIRVLQSLGLTFGVVVLADCESAEESSREERAWIAFLRAAGADLTNITDGGEGIPGFTHREETRRKLSEAAKLRPPWRHTPESRAAISRGNLGKKHPPASPELCAGRRARMLGKPKSPEHRAAISAALTGRVMSESQRLAMAKRSFRDESGEVYRTLGEAARRFQLNVGHIWRVLNMKTGSAKGHVFSYV